MIKINKLQDFKLYSNQQISFSNYDKKKRHNKMIMILSDNINSVSTMLNDNIFMNEYLRSYYVKNRYVVPGISYQFKNNRNKLYKQIKSKNKELNQFKRDVEGYRGLNLIYDLSNDIDQFNNNVKLRSVKRIEGFNELLKYHLLGTPGLDTYTEDVIYVPVDYKLDDNESVNNVFQSLNHTSIISLIYSLFRIEDINTLYIEHTPIIFYNSKSQTFFKTTGNEIRHNPSIFRSRLELYLKMNTSLELTPEEIELVGSVISEKELPIEATMDINDEVEIKKLDIRNEFLRRINPITKLDPGMKGIVKGAKHLEVQDKVIEKVDNFIDNEVDRDPNSIEDLDAETVMENLKDDDELLQYFNEIKEAKIEKPIEDLDQEMIQDLKDTQDTVEFEGKTLSEIIKGLKADEVVNTEIPVDVLNDELKISTLKDLDANYNRHQKDADLIAVLTTPSQDPEYPLFIKNIERTDTSDGLNKKETISVTYEGVDKTKHNFKVDIPKVVDDRYLVLNGSKKSISKQILRLPIVKTKPDRVEIASNYNKLLVERFNGTKISPEITKFKKYLDSGLLDKVPSTKLEIARGDNSKINSDYVNPLDYDEISKFLISINISGYKLLFDRAQLDEQLEKLELEELPNDRQIPLGTKGRQSVIIYNEDDGSISLLSKGKDDVELGSSLVNAIINLMANNIDPEMLNQYNKHKAGKSYVYSRVKISGVYVPMVILLGHYKGLRYILDNYVKDYKFSEKRVRMTPEESFLWNELRFADGYVYYPATPLRYSIMLNGLREIDIRNYNFQDMDEDFPYLEYFQNTHGRVNLSKGVKNILDLMIDPITRDVLEDLGLPTTITGALFYSNTLLESNRHERLNDISNYRIRGNEQINAHIYKTLADAFKTYKDAKKSGNTTVRTTVPQDTVLKEISQSPVVDEMSVLNPVLEVEKVASSTFKGLGGINTDEGFVMGIRAYDESMVGLFGLSSPDSDKVGVVRQLTYNPKIANNRGMLIPDVKTDDMNALNMATPAELLSPFTLRHADPPRIGMQTTQTKHVLPTARTDKPLFSTGLDKTLPYVIGTDFVHRAKQDGVVKLLDEANELMIVEYKDGSHDTVDLSMQPAKNSNGGFYISNQKTTKLKEGQRFKKDDIIAHNEDYFEGEKKDVTFTVGTLAKIAMTPGSFTFEDSSLVSHELSHRMGSYITTVKQVVLGPNATVDDMVVKGQDIKTGDPLIVFEESFEDQDANLIVDAIGDEFGESIEALASNTIRSNQTGDVVDIKIYYNRPLEEFSPSLKKIINKYIRDVNRREKVIKGSLNKGESIPDSYIGRVTEMIDSDKIKGKDVDGVLIEFYTRYYEPLDVGGKLTFDVALKSIVAEVTPKGEFPVSEFRPEEEISAIISPLSVISRMTGDFYLTAWMNKVLVELKRKVDDIYYE